MLRKQEGHLYSCNGGVVYLLAGLCFILACWPGEPGTGLVNVFVTLTAQLFKHAKDRIS